MMTPADRQPIIVADAGPLIRLAAAGQLSSMRGLDRRIVLVDRVEDEVCGDPTKPFAGEIAAWIATMGPAILRAQTAVGIGVATLRSRQRTPEEDAILKAALRDFEELALREFLDRWRPTESTSAVVVYEDRKVPGLVMGAEYPLTLMTTRTFVRVLQGWGINVGAVDALEAIAHRYDLKPALIAEIDPRSAGGSPSAPYCLRFGIRPMTKQRLYLFDTTLRDGAQTSGVDFSVADKQRIARVLDELGIDYIEGGYPGANDTDTAFFGERPRLKHAMLTAFGMTKRAGRSAANDPGFQATVQSSAEAVCLVAKAWDYHVRVALEISNEENLAGIAESVKAIAARSKEPMIDCEHFFDGYKANPAYALACARAAYEAGARWVVLCDTNGGTLPHEIEAIVGEVVKVIPGAHVGIHTHNDTENAVANTLAAVRAGARQIQGTLNGLGERCGNANLTTLIPTLLLKPELAERFEIGVTPERLAKLTHASRLLDEMLNRAPNKQAPYVGESAFVTKAGIHASAIMKDPATYEHVKPEAVGNRRRLLVSNQAGKSNILAELERLGVVIPKGDPRIGRLLEEVKQKEALGYAYEGADASFELLARRTLGQVPQFFRVESFRVMVERRFNALGQLITVSEAVVKVTVDGATKLSVGEGNGPVNALDQALRKDLYERYEAQLKDVELADYKVRILTGGTEAVTRVLVESHDKRTGARWSTVGVSPNIIDASFEALSDSITYKLLRESEAAQQRAAKSEARRGGARSRAGAARAH